MGLYLGHSLRDNGFMQCGALDFSRLIAKGGNTGGLSHSGK